MENKEISNEEKVNLKRNNKNKLIIGVISCFSIIVIAILSWLMINNNKKIDINQLKKSVVQINVLDKNNETIAVGSGVVAFENNLIITNAHVIEDNYKIQVISENNKKHKVQGIIAYNKKKDIAILKLKDDKGLKTLDINKKISVGDDIIAIGSPLGLKNIVSDGILSGYFKDNIKVYQHTAPISSGSSGGALFDKEGKLVGITYATMEEGQNLNFAIPIKEVEKEYQIVKENKIINTKYYKYLNNGILKTKKGSILLDYILNDKYDNEKFKSGVQDESKIGNFNSSLSLKNSNYVPKEDYKKISKYVKSFVYLNSGISSNIGTIKNGKLDTSTATDGEGYTIVILNLKDSSNTAINKIKQFLKNEFEFSKKEIKSNDKYVYGIKCDNYNDENKVIEIMKEFK